MHNEPESIDAAFAAITAQLDVDVWEPRVSNLLDATDLDLRRALRSLRTELVHRGELHIQHSDEGRVLRGDFDLVSALMLDRGVV